MTKFPCSVFLMIAKDSTERPSAIALSKALLLRAANAFRMTWSERIFSSDTPPKCLHRDCVGRRRTGTGHGNVYLSVREKQGIVTGNYFISNVFYLVLQTVISLGVVSLVFVGHDLLKIADFNPRQEARFSLWKKINSPREGRKWSLGLGYN